MTFRTRVYSRDANDDPKLVVPVLERWLQNSHSKATIRLQHTDVFSIEAGPCGLTIPHLYAPYCGDYTLTDGDTEAEAIAATSSTASPGINSDTSTAVIIASVFGAVIAVMFMITLGTLGYIIGRKRYNGNPAGLVKLSLIHI